MSPRRIECAVHHAVSRTAAEYEQATGAGTVVFVNEDQTEIGSGHITVSAKVLEVAPGTGTTGAVTLDVPSGNQAPTQRGTVECFDVRSQFAAITGVLEDTDQTRPYFQISIRDSGAPGTEGPDQVTVVVSPDPFLSCRARPSADLPVERGNFTVKDG